jgi:hypothetical protein
MLLGLCGCDLVFPLHPPAMQDGGDATPVGCPMQGPPALDPDAHVIVADSCIDYSVSFETGFAVGTCGGAIVEGPIDSGSLAPSVLLPADTTFPSNPRASPSGTELFLTARDGTGKTIRIYRRVGMSWVHDPTATTGLPSIIGSTDSVSASAPTAGMVGREIVVSTRIGNQPAFTEWSDDGAGTWTPGRSYTPASFEVADMKDPSITEDGLRLVFVANQPAGDSKIHYAERGAPTDAFGMPVVIDTIFRAPQDPYLTQQCEHLYVVNILSVNYFTQ